MYVCVYIEMSKCDHMSLCVVVHVSHRMCTSSHMYLTYAYLMWYAHLASYSLTHSFTNITEKDKAKADAAAAGGGSDSAAPATAATAAGVSETKAGADDVDHTADYEHAAACIGYGAVKYYDLKRDRLLNYKFSFDEMLSLTGDTCMSMSIHMCLYMCLYICLHMCVCICGHASIVHVDVCVCIFGHLFACVFILCVFVHVGVFSRVEMVTCVCVSPILLPSLHHPSLCVRPSMHKFICAYTCIIHAGVYLLYAYARICSILRKGSIPSVDAKIDGHLQLAHPSEIGVAIHLIRWPEVSIYMCVCLWICLSVHVCCHPCARTFVCAYVYVHLRVHVYASVWICTD